MNNLAIVICERQGLFFINIKECLNLSTREHARVDGPQRR